MYRFLLIPTLQFPILSVPLSSLRPVKSDLSSPKYPSDPSLEVSLQILETMIATNLR